MQQISELKQTASGPGQVEALSRAEEGARNELVVAQVPQGYATTINIRVVRGVDFDLFARARGCQPRQGAPRRDAEMLDLPADLVDKLKAADQAVVKWLAADEANVQLFLRQPAEALLKAGVELSRADQKAIARTHNDVQEASVVAPGVRVASLNAAAFPRGKVGKIKPSAGTSDRPEKDSGCAKEE